MWLTKFNNRRYVGALVNYDFRTLLAKGDLCGNVRKTGIGDWTASAGGSVGYGSTRKAAVDACVDMHLR